MGDGDTDPDTPDDGTPDEGLTLECGVYTNAAAVMLASAQTAARLLLLDPDTGRPKKPGHGLDNVVRMVLMAARERPSFDALVDLSDAIALFLQDAQSVLNGEEFGDGLCDVISMMGGLVTVGNMLAPFVGDDDVDARMEDVCGTVGEFVSENGDDPIVARVWDDDDGEEDDDGE